MKTFIEWLEETNLRLNKHLSRITLDGIGGKFKFVIENIASGIRSEHFYVDLTGKATMTQVATSASGRINNTLGGLDNKEVTRQSPTDDPNMVKRYGFESTNGSVEKPGIIMIEISLDSFREVGNKYASMHFKSEWTNWQLRGVEGIDKPTALTLVDLINQELNSGRGAETVAHISNRATRNDSKERTIGISINDLAFHQKVS
jgi:hypothetical protein